MIQKNGAPVADKGKNRKDIRHAIVSLLKDKTDAANRVFPNASIPPWSEELPVILVYPRSETANVYGQAPLEYERNLDIAVEIVGQGPEENLQLDGEDQNQKFLEDTLDDIAEQVEGLLANDDTFGGVADASVLQNTELEYDSAGGQPIGSCRLTYNVTYYTYSPRDQKGQNIGGTFTGAEVEYDINQNQETIEAKDTVNVP